MGIEAQRYSRGYLPHIQTEGRQQFITWRLDDSLPASLILRWSQELDTLNQSEQRREMARRVERHCDEGHGACLMRDPRIARIVQERLFETHGKSHWLHSWVVMPNHVHVLTTPVAGMGLGQLMREIKGVSARRVNQALNLRGRLWQPDYFDRLIRDPDHASRVQRYLHWNPVKAGLCTDPKLYPWSSANDAARARFEAIDLALKVPSPGAG